MTISKDKSYERELAISKMSFMVAMFGYTGVSFSEWWQYRRMYSCQPKHLMGFGKGWAFDLRLVRNGGNDWDYPMVIIGLIWGRIYITIPYWPATDWDDEREWGVNWFEDVVWFRWGNHQKTVYLPWGYTWVRTSYLLTNEKDLATDTAYKLKKANQNRRSLEPWNEPLKSQLWRCVYVYTYILKDGTVQKRLATVTVSEREWRRRWLTWTHYLAMVSRTIDVHFDREVGERSGSYKGGTMGCDYELKPGETPLDCLRRMEKERKFN